MFSYFPEKVYVFGMVIKTKKILDLSFLKGQCHEIFVIFFISWIEAIRAPEKQAKMVLLKNYFFCKDICEIIDSVQA